MIRQFRLISVSLGVILALSVAMVAKAESDATGEATVVVYRADESLKTRKLSYNVNAGSVKLGRLKNDSSVTVRLPAGEHVFTTNMKGSSSITLLLQPGETHYIVAGTSARGTKVDVSLGEVEEKLALLQQPKIEFQI